MQESASSEGWFTSAFSWLVSSTPKDTSQSLATGTGRNTVRLHPLTPTGSLQALLYEDDPVVWQTRVRTSDATPGRSTVSDPYRNFLKGAAQLVRAHALQAESVPLLVTLGPPWQDKEMYRHWQASTWEERDVRWECPTGLGMIPLDQLFAICCRLHEHLGMVEGPQSSGSGPESNRFAILHSHTCSNTSSQLSTFVAVCHLLYSCGFDSVNDALQTLQAIPPNLQARKLLQGQRRYCDYVNCIIHMDYLPPESDKSVVLKHVTFRKLNAFAAMKYGGLTMAPKGESERGTPSRRPVAHAMPSDGSEASTPREGSLPGSRSHTPTPWWQYDLEQADSDKLNPDRILLSVISRGVELWAGGVAPGSVDEEEDLVCFDFTRRGGGEGLTLLGDFVLALWFDDHKSTYDRPAISYVDHTAFLGHSSGDAASEISRRITARQLDVSNPSYADYADKEGFYMEVTFRRGESPGEGAVLGPCMNLHVPTVRAERAEVISRFGMIRCELEDGEESEGRQPSARAVIRQLRSHQKLKTPPYRLQTATGDDQLPEDNSPLVSSSGNLSFGYGGGMHPIFLQTSEVELTPLGSNRSSEQGSTCTPRMASTTVLPQGDEPEVTSRLASNGIANSNEAQGADGDEVITSQVHAEHQLQSPGSIGKKKGLPPPPPPPLPPGGDTTEHQLQSPGSVGKKKGLPPPPLPPGGDTTDSQLKSPGSVVKKKGLPPPPPPPLPPGGDTTEHQLKSPGSVGKKKGLPPPPPPPLPPGGETTEHQLQSPGSVGKKKGLPPPPPPPLPPGSRSPVASLSESSPGGDTTESQLQSPGSVGRKKSLAPPPPPPLPPGGDTTESQLQSPGSVGKKKSLAPPPPPPPPLPPGNKPASPASAKTNEKKAPPAPPSPALSNHFTPGPKLRSYYWSKARTGQGTVWDEIAPVSELSDPYAEALISLFKVNATPMKENMSPGSGVKKKTVPTIVKVIPLPRANNISIMLTKFSEFGGRLGDNIRDAIMSGSERLSTEQLTLLAQIAPTPDESKALTAYPGPPSELSPPEQFLLTMTTVPRLQAKISTLMFLRQFESLCSDALAGLEALCAACNQIRSSKRFRRVLATILATGNMLNAGTHRGNAEAVKFESLLKMGDLKVTKISQKSDEKDLQESLSVKVPPIRSLVDFIAWTVLLQSVSQNEFSGKDALEIARNGFLAHELSSLTDAVKRMQLDVVEALTALDSGMSAVRREVDAEGPTRNSGDFCFETEPQSRFQRVLQSFIDTADKEQEMIKAFAEKSQKQVSMTIKWLGESADSDALTVFQMVRTFMNDFDQAFGRICRSIDKDGI